jgi:hypothetical protein
MGRLTDERGGLRKPKDRGEHVRLIMDLMGVDEAEAEFIVSIERGECLGDVFIAGGKNDPGAPVQSGAASRTPAPVDDD